MKHNPVRSMKCLKYPCLQKYHPQPLHGIWRPSHSGMPHHYIRNPGAHSLSRGS